MAYTHAETCCVSKTLAGLMRGSRFRRSKVECRGRVRSWCGVYAAKLPCTFCPAKNAQRRMRWQEDRMAIGVYMDGDLKCENKAVAEWRRGDRGSALKFGLPVAGGGERARLKGASESQPAPAEPATPLHSTHNQNWQIHTRTYAVARRRRIPLGRYTQRRPAHRYSIESFLRWLVPSQQVEHGHLCAFANTIQNEPKQLQVEDPPAR